LNFNQSTSAILVLNKTVLSTMKQLKCHNEV